MLGSAIDVFRLRQYFDVVTRVREIVAGVREDAGLLDDARRALVRLPSERAPAVPRPFPGPRPLSVPGAEGRRLALMATGGSGALASVVGVARALEEAGVRPSVISLCSGSSLFGFPLGAGLCADDVAAFTLGLEPADYVDVDWRLLAGLLPTLGRGFAGVIKGERIERTYRRLLGDRCLGDLAIPTYAPIWNVEENRLEYVGPRTHPDLPVARAVRMAVSLPLFIEPVELGGGHWCDGGIVDIFPVRPVLEIEEPCDVALAVNGFYPPRFAGEDATGWERRPASILYAAAQIRTCQQVELARTNLEHLERVVRVAMIEPVPYQTVRGAGFYRQFLTTSSWASFMAAGRRHARRALPRLFVAGSRPQTATRAS